MKILAEGFFAEPSNSLSHSEEDIRSVQDNSMRLLYRMLFIFYAEAGSFWTPITGATGR